MNHSQFGGLSRDFYGNFFTTLFLGSHKHIVSLFEGVVLMVCLTFLCGKEFWGNLFWRVCKLVKKSAGIDDVPFNHLREM